MELNEKNLSRKNVLIISLIAFLAVIIVLSTVTIFINNREEDNSTNVSTEELSVNEYQSFESETDSIYSEPDASQTFAESTEDETSTEAPDKYVEGWVINEYGYTYVYEGVGYEQFNFGMSSLNRYANSINKLANLFGNYPPVYNITVPVSATFVNIPYEIRERDNYYNSYQSTFVSTLASKLDENVTNIPLVSIIEEKYNDGEYVFFRSDRNWTQLAAYEGYVAFCQSAGLVPYSLQNFKSVGSMDFLGSFYLATKSSSMKNNPDKIVCYSTIPTVNTSLFVYDYGLVYENYTLCGNEVTVDDAYDIYLGTTAGRYEINSNAKGGDLLIIGDSSVFPMVPFLASHYSKIDIIYPECFDMSIEEFIEGKKYDAVLTMCYSTNAVNGYYIPAFENITEVKDDE